MAKTVLDGPAEKKVRSLAAALDEDNGDLIRRRWGVLRGMLGQRLVAFQPQIRQLLTDEQAARLARMTSFEA